VHGHKGRGRGQNRALIGFFLFSRACVPTLLVPLIPSPHFFFVSVPAVPCQDSRGMFSLLASSSHSREYEVSLSRSGGAQQFEANPDQEAHLQEIDEICKCLPLILTDFKVSELVVTADVVHWITKLDGPLQHIVRQAPSSFDVRYWLLWTDAELVAAAAEHWGHHHR